MDILKVNQGGWELNQGLHQDVPPQHSFWVLIYLTLWYKDEED
ncbi:unnamed protein product, partial [marine sediment metagenome]